MVVNHSRHIGITRPCGPLVTTSQPIWIVLRHWLSIRHQFSANHAHEYGCRISIHFAVSQSHNTLYVISRAYWQSK